MEIVPAATRPVVLAQRALAGASDATGDGDDAWDKCFVKLYGLKMLVDNGPVLALADEGCPKWVHSCHNDLVREAIRCLRLNSTLAPVFQAPRDLEKQELRDLLAPESVPLIEHFLAAGCKGAIITLTGPYARALELANAPRKFVGLATRW